ncbi:neuromedin-U isoform X4 [Pelodiscus sinensis]|uniref:neuromedin-U isoform X4 n=1 Tax=Pelodiscus sinensis TaxID=13735 RepID=UPI003F6BE5FB
MLGDSGQQRTPVQQHAAGSRGSQPGLRKQPASLSGASGALLLLLLASWTCASQGVPMPSQELQTEQDSQLWHEIDDACSAYLSIIDPHPEASNALEELCFMVMGFLQKPQNLEEKDNTKRFLFHYAKSHDSGNSDMMEELQGLGGIQSRGYFLFRPRNGRSAGFH